MNWKQARFVTTKVNPKELPKLPHSFEIALIGRSNAGKSSFFNALTSQPLAKTSKAPGKTRTLNLFSIGPHLSFVDLPGYGYAQRSKEEQKGWSEFILSYLKSRDSLKLLILIMDMRRRISEEETCLLTLAASLNLPVFLILNKCDKLNQTERHQAEKTFKEDLEEFTFTAFPVSSRTGEGIDETRKAIENFL